MIVPLPQVSSSLEPALGLSDSFMLQAEELVPKVSAETPPAEVIEENVHVTLPSSVSESSVSVSLSSSSLESVPLWVVLVLNVVVVVTVKPV